MTVHRNWQSEIDEGARFEFGANWKAFLRDLSPARVDAAQLSLQNWLGLDSLDGKSFLDIGSGSGLFSLAARRLGARVASFDYDPESVAGTIELKRRYFPDDDRWTVQAGSALDDAFLEGLGTFDVVYSWGVLHHTGELWRALENAARRVAPEGHLFIAIYNDQGRPTRRWKALKRAYVRAPRSLRWFILAAAFVRLWGTTLARDAASGHPLRTWRSYDSNGRGMHPWRDVVDWVGGYPFEVAKPEQIIDACLTRGFQLRKLKTCGGGLGCNEFVFVRRPT